MEDSYVADVIRNQEVDNGSRVVNRSNVQEAYVESYKQHNLQTKEYDPPACHTNVKWAWSTFGECLLGPAHITGYLIGALSLPFWLIGSFMLYLHLWRLSPQVLWNVLILVAIVDFVSFVGALMSMQMMLLISYDLFTTVLDVLAVLTLAAITLRHWHSGKKPLSEVCDLHTGLVVSSSANQDFLGVTSGKVCCLSLCVVMASLLSVVVLTVTVATVPRDTEAEPLPNMTLKHPVLFSTVGYIFGCCACFGRWGVEIIALRFAFHFSEKTSNNRVWKGGGVLLLTADFLYLLGVLLQSGGIRVVMVTLPWLIGRGIQGCFQIFKLKSTKMSELCIFETVESDDIGDDIDESIVECVNLLGSSDSEAGDNYVLWDRSWQIPGKPSVQVHYDERSQELRRHSSVSKPGMLITANVVTSTTESDGSSSSQEQELIWEYEGPTTRQNGADHNGVPARQGRLSLASQIATLSETSSQSCAQRVQTWISQSTPEQETPPCLTLTLNLETIQDFNRSLVDTESGGRKMYSAMPPSPRKYSF